MKAAPEIWAMSLQKKTKLSTHLRDTSEFVTDVIIKRNNDNRYASDLLGAYGNVDGDILHFYKPISTQNEIHYEIITLGYEKISKGTCLASDIAPTARLFGACRYDTTFINEKYKRNRLYRMGLRNNGIRRTRMQNS